MNYLQRYAHQPLPPATRPSLEMIFHAWRAPANDIMFVYHLFLACAGIRMTDGSFGVSRLSCRRRFGISCSASDCCFWLGLTGEDVTLKVLLFDEYSERGDPKGSPCGERIVEGFSQWIKWKSRRVSRLSASKTKHWSFFLSVVQKMSHTVLFFFLLGFRAVSMPASVSHDSTCSARLN